jgi:hypothetical protein
MQVRCGGLVIHSQISADPIGLGASEFRRCDCDCVTCANMAEHPYFESHCGGLWRPQSIEAFVRVMDHKALSKKRVVSKLAALDVDD